MASVELIPFMSPNELLRELVYSKRLCVKQLAAESGKSDKYLYRMKEDPGTPVTMHVARCAFRLTEDLRWPSFILSGSNWSLSQIEQIEPTVLSNPVDALPPSAEALQLKAQCVNYVAHIVRDGKVDKYDRLPLDNLKRHHLDEYRKTTALIASLEAMAALSGDRP